jgi:hypothetical protein
MSRLTAQQSDMVRAGQQLVPSPKILPALLALLHRHMTGHPLIAGPSAPWLRCVSCTLRRDVHVREGDRSWQLRCPADAPVSLFGWFVPSKESPARALEALVMTGKLQMMHDGSLENTHSRLFSHANWYERSGRYACNLWCAGCEDEEVNRIHRQEQHLAEVAIRAWLRQPFFVGIPGVHRPWVFGDCVLTAAVHGSRCFETQRRVVISAKSLRWDRLLEFVFALGQGAKCMQQEAWLEVEVRITPEESPADTAKLMDVIVMLLHLCKKLVLTGRGAVHRAYTLSSDTGDPNAEFLFISLELIALDCAAMDRLLA